MDAAASLEGVVLDRKYRLIRVVAEGGFAVVYQGEHLGLSMPIAVKILKAGRVTSAAGAFAERLALEARLIARLRHPDIVQALDTGVYQPGAGGDGVPYIVLEWLEGETLKQHLVARRGARGRAPKECLALLAPVFAAIAHAHAHGIAHRDVKPSNILLARSERGVSAKVLDFGIAKAMQEGATGDGQATATNLRLFSRSHAAPEQIAGEATGPWTDVHALALLVSELLTNRPPYPSEDGVELARLALSANRPTPAAAGVDVGPWQAKLARALSLRASERQANADELFRELQAELEAAERAFELSPAATQPEGVPASGESRTFGSDIGGTYSRSAEPLPAVRSSRVWRRARVFGLGAFALAGLGIVASRARQSAPVHGVETATAAATAPTAGTATASTATPSAATASANLALPARAPLSPLTNAAPERATAPARSAAAFPRGLDANSPPAPPRAKLAVAPAPPSAPSSSNPSSPANAPPAPLTSVRPLPYQLE